MITLGFRHLINALRVVADSINALPAGDRVGPDNWVNSSQVGSNILRCTALGTVELEVVLLGTLVEDRLCISGSQALEELLVRWRKTVVDLIARRPQSISASLGELCQAEDRIITWHRFESDVAVPSLFVALALVAAETLGVQLLRLLRTNDRDFIILAAESTATVGDWVNVQFGSSRLARKLAQALSQLFLEIVVEAILLAEEDHAALRDCFRSVSVRN